MSWRNPNERHEAGRQLRQLAGGGPDALAVDEQTPARQAALPPGPPPRDVDLVLGVLDEIRAAVADLAAGERGPAGEGTVAAAQVVTAPAAGAVIASVPAPGAGRFKVRVTVSKDAGAVALDLALRIGALRLSPLPTSTAAAAYEFDDVAIDGGEAVEVIHPAGAAGTFLAHIAVTRIA